MNEFDELSRRSYRVDAAAKAAEQEREELSRGSYRPNARQQAEAQEAQDRADERIESEAAGRQAKRGRQHRVAASAGADGRDLADHTVMRRTAPRTSSEEQLGGGAVISKRSGLGARLRRRSQGSDDRSWQRELRREERRQKRLDRKQYRGGGRRPGLRLLTMLVAVVALYLVTCGPIDRAISFSRSESEGLTSARSWHVPGMPYYVLALGSDAREGETVSRTDTMMLVRVDPIGGKVTMLSIPRDTKVQIEGQGTQKINAAYTFGGAAGAVRAVHELTGAPISHVALVKFDGVQGLVDYLGGVTVNVPVDVYDPDYTGLVLPAGEHEMNGETALLFSRVRHGFDLGDYQRQKDQRILMEAIMQKTFSLPPTRLPGLMTSMGSMVSTTMRMYSIIPLMARLKLGMTIYQATVPSTTAMEDGISYVIADEAALSQMMDVIDRGGDPATLAQ